MIPKLLLFSMLIALILPLYSHAGATDDKNTLHKRIEQCELCHSIDTKVPSIAPSLDGMADGYIVEQLENFRQSRRGVDSADQFTQDMSQQANALNDRQISLIADYYSGRKRHHSNESVSGNAENGEHLYAQLCEGCHSSILGRYFTKSPRITHLRGSYLRTQLEEFSAGKRQVMKDSEHKLKMVEVAGQLSGREQSDIVAFIKEHYTD